MVQVPTVVEYSSGYDYSTSGSSEYDSDYSYYGNAASPFAEYHNTTQEEKDRILKCIVQNDNAGTSYKKMMAKLGNQFCFMRNKIESGFASEQKK